MTTMAIQKKSLIGKQQSAKKALVAKRVSTEAPKATQVKAPNLIHHHTTYAPVRKFAPYAPIKAKSTLKNF